MSRSACIMFMSRSHVSRMYSNYAASFLLHTRHFQLISCVNLHAQQRVHVLVKIVRISKIFISQRHITADLIAAQDPDVS